MKPLINLFKYYPCLSQISLWVILWIPISFIFPNSLSIFAPVLAFIEILEYAKEGGGFFSDNVFTEMFLPCLIFWGVITLLVMNNNKRKNGSSK